MGVRVHEISRATQKMCVRTCRDFQGCSAAAAAEGEGGRGGAGDRQRSHLTLHVLNRLKDFFFSSQISPPMPEAQRRLVRIIKIDDIE